MIPIHKLKRMNLPENHEYENFEGEEPEEDLHDLLRMVKVLDMSPLITKFDRSRRVI